MQGRIHGVVDDTIANSVLVGGLVATPILGLWGLGFIVAGVFSRFVSPDFDIVDVTVESKHKVYRLNWFLGMLWEVYWLPYGLLNRHRGRSHKWLGTVERCLYLYWLPMLSFYQIGIQYPYLQGTILLFWLAVFVGHGVVDRAHVRLDRMRYF